MGDGTNRTPKARRNWKPAWLAAFENEGTVTAACKATGIGRTAVYAARQQDEAFAIAWADLEEQTTERMECEAYRRAVHGVQSDIFYRDEVIGEETKYSDTLLIFMLKARRPERYRDNVKVEHSGSVQTSTRLIMDDELAGEARALLRRAAASSGN